MIGNFFKKSDTGYETKSEEQRALLVEVSLYSSHGKSSDNINTESNVRYDYFFGWFLVALTLILFVVTSSTSSHSGHGLDRSKSLDVCPMWFELSSIDNSISIRLGECLILASWTIPDFIMLVYTNEMQTHCQPKIEESMTHVFWTWFRQPGGVARIRNLACTEWSVHLHLGDSDTCSSLCRYIFWPNCSYSTPPVKT